MRYFNFKYPLTTINDTLYQVIAEYSLDIVKDAKGIKELLGCDTIFKQHDRGVYLFCNIVPDVDYVDVND